MIDLSLFDRFNALNINSNGFCSDKLDFSILQLCLSTKTASSLLQVLLLSSGHISGNLPL